MLLAKSARGVRLRAFPYLRDDRPPPFFRFTPEDGIESKANFLGQFGAEPYGRPLGGGDGMLYGTCSNGVSPENAGTIFRYTPGGAVEMIHHFTRATGMQSTQGLSRGLDGHLYGTADAGGTVDDKPAGGGVIFRLSLDPPSGPRLVLRRTNGTLFPGSLPKMDFGMVSTGTPAGPFELVIRNAGGAALELGELAITGEDAADFELELQGSPRWRPGGEALLRVSYSPVMGGEGSATLALPSNDPHGPPALILSGSSGTTAEVWRHGYFGSAATTRTTRIRIATARPICWSGPSGCTR